MAGISDKAAGGVENKYKYNGKELQHREFNDGSGLEEYDYGARMQDPQLGMWHNIDPLAEKGFDYTPYDYCINNPIALVDPNGMSYTEFETFNKIESGEVGTVEDYQRTAEKEKQKNQEGKNNNSASNSNQDTNNSNGGQADVIPNNNNQNNNNTSNPQDGGHGKKKKTNTKNTNSGSNGATTIDQFSTAAGLATESQATIWSALSKFGVDELERFGKYATGVGGPIATGDLGYKLAKGKADWKDYTSFTLAWGNVILMKATETTPNPATAAGEVIVGVGTLLFDIYRAATSK